MLTLPSQDEPELCLPMYLSDHGPRQVRAEGRVEIGSEQDNAHCVIKYPRNMNILALAYKQSTIIPDRKTYVDRVRKVHTVTNTARFFPAISRKREAKAFKNHDHFAGTLDTGSLCANSPLSCCFTKYKRR